MLYRFPAESHTAIHYPEARHSALLQGNRHNSYYYLQLHRQNAIEERSMSHRLEDEKPTRAAGDSPIIVPKDDNASAVGAAMLILLLILVGLVVAYSLNIGNMQNSMRTQTAPPPQQTIVPVPVPVPTPQGSGGTSNTPGSNGTNATPGTAPGDTNPGGTGSPSDSGSPSGTSTPNDSPGTTP